jgi:Reversibly glycosylated polypeptide
MRPGLITTTIYLPELLEAYVDDAIAHGHQDTLVVVVGDRKTPAEAKPWCLELAARRRVDLVYMDCDDQVAYLRRYPELGDHLVWNSIQRRNIAILVAYERGCDPIITIDDDNFLSEPDFIGHHCLAGREAELPALTSDTGWVNVCRDLEERNGVPFYHRGFPPGERWRQASVEQATRRGRVVVNAGLWLDDPDVDAIQRLVYPIETVRYARDGNFCLGKGTWSPFNSQNTALAREVVPGYFLSPQIGRYDDIWASYSVVRIAEHLDHLVAYGHPLVRHERSPHNLWVDLDREREMEVTDRFCAALRQIPLSGSDYGTCLHELATGLRRWLADGADGLKEDKAVPVERFVAGLEVWRATMDQVAAPV